MDLVLRRNPRTLPRVRERDPLSEPLSTRFETRGGLTQINDHLYRSPLPVKAQHWRVIHDAGIDLVVSLDSRVRHPKRYDFNRLTLDWVDDEPPTNAQAQELLRVYARARETQDRKKILVHCASGWGRTGTAIALILASEGATAEAALATFYEKVPAAKRFMESSGQADFVRTFYERELSPERIHPDAKYLIMRLEGWANGAVARYGEGTKVYLVGSTLTRGHAARDVDISVVVPDDLFAARYDKGGDGDKYAKGEDSATPLPRDWNPNAPMWSPQMRKHYHEIASETAWLVRSFGHAYRPFVLDLKILSAEQQRGWHFGKPRLRIDTIPE